MLESSLNKASIYKKRNNENTHDIEDKADFHYFNLMVFIGVVIMK